METLNFYKQCDTCQGDAYVIINGTPNENPQFDEHEDCPICNTGLVPNDEVIQEWLDKWDDLVSQIIEERNERIKHMHGSLMHTTNGTLPRPLKTTTNATTARQRQTTNNVITSKIIRKNYITIRTLPSIERMKARHITAEYRRASEKYSHSHALYDQNSYEIDEQNATY